MSGPQVIDLPGPVQDHHRTGLAGWFSYLGQSAVNIVPSYRRALRRSRGRTIVLTRGFGDLTRLEQRVALAERLRELLKGLDGQAPVAGEGGGLRLVVEGDVDEVRGGQQALGIPRAVDCRIERAERLRIPRLARDIFGDPQQVGRGQGRLRLGVSGPA